MSGDECLNRGPSWLKTLAKEASKKIWKEETPFTDPEWVQKLKEKFALLPEGNIEFNVENQIKLFKLLSKYFSEVNDPSKWKYFKDNPRFSDSDAVVLYAFIRHFKPRRIVQIGSGHSTMVMLQAIEENEKEQRQQLQEQQPTLAGNSNNPVLSNAPSKFKSSPKVLLTVLDGRGLDNLEDLKSHHSLKLLEQDLDTADMSIFTTLHERDLLFTETSHVVKLYGDVAVLYTLILPALKRGCFVHLHGIFLPTDYPSRWVIEKEFPYSEQLITAAFLYGNRYFDIAYAPWALLNSPEGKALIESTVDFMHSRYDSSFYIVKSR